MQERVPDTPGHDDSPGGRTDGPPTYSGDDFTLEELIPLEAVCKLLKRRRDTRALRRWVLDGQGGIYLRAVEDGKHLYTTARWVCDFIAATTNRRNDARRASSRKRHESTKRTTSRPSGRTRSVLDKYGLSPEAGSNET
ncbi:hypothetical protein [Engelhardtia mirabilis]|uniref:Uncharacterized protein n=1 Tax=Engelhardtia mirabilis TaxID=2528011 RepID=A0A518BH56_9BACT|nr:hypothetical protein Pla133_13900 [Planctomycetes bacterium Pla133]QDV00646.1 hypothetical protein Pla86_13890 [Planctomycetes bacterium Pla86]